MNLTCYSIACGLCSDRGVWWVHVCSKRSVWRSSKRSVWRLCGCMCQHSSTVKVLSLLAP